jgi:hypothetical protein
VDDKVRCHSVAVDFVWRIRRGQRWLSSGLPLGVPTLCKERKEWATCGAEIGAEQFETIAVSAEN